MIRMATITRMIKSFLTETTSIGGVTQNRFINPKGLYSKPKNEKAIIINLAGGANQDVVMALQKDIDLEDGDVYVTDDKSYIHFHFANGTIEIKTKDLILNLDNLEINAKEVSYNTQSIKSNGKSIDDKHTHQQNAGDHFGAGATTTPPNN